MKLLWASLLAKKAQSVESQAQKKRPQWTLFYAPSLITSA